VLYSERNWKRHWKRCRWRETVKTNGQREWETSVECIICRWHRTWYLDRWPNFTFSLSLLFSLSLFLLWLLSFSLFGLQHSDWLKHADAQTHINNMNTQTTNSDWHTTSKTGHKKVCTCLIFSLSFSLWAVHLRPLRRNHHRKYFTL